MIDTVFRVLARWRHARAVHSPGVALRGVLRATGRDPVARLLSGGEPERDVLVRVSKGAGTPGTWPDVLGLAVRVPGGRPGGPLDLLFDSSGSLPVLRALPLPRRNWRARPYSTVLPYRVDGGLRWIGAFPAGGERLPSSTEAFRAAAERHPVMFTLTVAEPFGRWRAVAELEVRGEPERVEWFDPMVNHHPELRPAPGVLVRLRLAAYRGSREGRGAPAHPRS
ncbi:hypothetical protein JOF41_002352 [Saccharothrix coeruleofusca]|uniref:hypothetical protein n=1 Tax=Saccharothrix coeruleofusca TaxID=33919 RepID=UPI001AE9BF4E|nr:hypothetical protein [Saccharothrix coeruleofusca]MBP2336174.1 hypothetical protein [Saccharothrix coeruleofusca]